MSHYPIRLRIETGALYLQCLVTDEELTQGDSAWADSVKPWIDREAMAT